MSAEKGHDSALEENFATKLGIRLVGTKQFADMIDQFADTPRVVVCGVGKAGIGKSQIARQRATDRGAPSMILHVPQMSVDDFYIPTSGVDSKEYYDKRIPRKFQDILEYCKRKENGDKTAKGNPMIIIEEPNRANDKNVTKALFTIIEDRTIGDTRIPDSVQIVCLMNPSENGMLVNEFEKDPAYRRRLLFVGVRLAPGEFLSYAEEKFHEKTVEFLRAQTKWIYDDNACAVGKVYANPAAWETVSDICRKLEAVGRPLTSRIAQDVIAGKIGTAATEAFMNYLKDADSVISAQDVLDNYAKADEKLRGKVKKMTGEGRGGVLIDLCTEIATTLFDGKKRDAKKFSKHLALFMDDLPTELLVDFIKYKLKSAADQIDGGADTFRDLSVTFSTEPSFQNAWKKYMTAVRKVEEAASR
jgi:hypothetical protein